jgi:acetolactate synthase-1/3 small subunit
LAGKIYATHNLSFGGKQVWRADARGRAVQPASRMTIVTRGDDATLEQIVKQLNKLPDVIKVHDFREGEYVDRELVLVKVAVDSKSRAEVMQITDIFRAKIVDVQPKSLSIEITGTEDKVEKFIELMKPFGLLDLTRTGKVDLPRR